MRLFKYENYRLIIAPEARTIKAFKDIIQRDRSSDGRNVEKEFAFIYFVYDPRSDLQYIVDEKERMDRAKELIGISKDFVIDKKLQSAIDVYKSMINTSSSMMLDDIRKGILKIREYITSATVDDETFDKYTRAINTLMPMSEKLAAIEEKVIKEVESVSKMRGDKAMTILDSGLMNFGKDGAE